MIPINFTVLSDYVFAYFAPFCIAHIEIAYSRTCHTATLTNLLCYTPISQIQGKSAY
nr:MAG TPA: hypothetical protein [Bacteriophage sp.]